MSVLIIGSLGSMGKRFSAILAWQGVKHVGVDKDTSLTFLNQQLSICDSIILCTPTQTHYELLLKLIPLGKPILCEKPITKDLDELAEILELVTEYKTPFTMMMQYRLLQPTIHDIDADSYYDYFRTGNDGLIWDTMQIIGLATGRITIKNQSPVWTCSINGAALRLSDMDLAYMDFVRKWLEKDKGIEVDLQELYRIHKKTHDIWHKTLGSKYEGSMYDGK